MPETYQKGNEIATIDVALVTVEDADGNIYGLKTSDRVQVNPVTTTNDAIRLIVKGTLIAQKPSRTTVTGNTIVLRDNVFNPILAMVLQGGTITYSKKYSSAAGQIAAGAHYITVTNGDETEYLVFNVASAISSGSVEYNDVTGVLEIVQGTSRTRKSYTVSTEQPASGTTAITVTNETDESRIKSYTPPVTGSTVQIEPFKLNCYSAIYNAAGLITGYERITYPNCQGVPVALSSEDDVFRVPEYTINSAPNTDEAPYTIDYVPRLPVEVENI